MLQCGMGMGGAAGSAVGVAKGRDRGAYDFIDSNDLIDYVPSSRNRPLEMATLTIRNLDSRLKEGLRVRAALNGHSMEAEARRILQSALRDAPPAREPDLAEAIRRRFADLGGVELELPARDLAREPPKFE
jgi:plasmid stability protein